MMNAENPWLHRQIDAEVNFHEGPGKRAIARDLVLNEYRNEPEPLNCDCGGQAWYKATIGCMKCELCGWLYTTAGDSIGKGARP